MRGQCAMLRWRWQIQRSHIINLVASPAALILCVYTAPSDRPITARPHTVRGYIYSYDIMCARVRADIYRQYYNGRNINPTYIIIIIMIINESARLYRDFSGAYGFRNKYITRDSARFGARNTTPRGLTSPAHRVSDGTHIILILHLFSGFYACLWVYLLSHLYLYTPTCHSAYPPIDHLRTHLPTATLYLPISDLPTFMPSAIA